MRTICEIPVGSELFNDYGPLPRSDLLRRYGYVTPSYAPFDVVEISAPHIISVCYAEGKQDRLDYLLDEDVLDDAYDIEASMEIPEEILVVMHTFLMSDEKFAEYKAKGKVPRPKLTLEVGRVFCTLLELRLQQYETTIEQDEVLLKDQSLSRRKRMAVEVRLGEKKILVGILEDVKRQLESKRDVEEENGRSTKRVRRS